MFEKLKKGIPLILVCGTAMYLLSGCGTMGVGTREPHPKKALAGIIEEIPKEGGSVALQYTTKGVRLLGQGRYEEASKAFNRSLKVDPANSYVQFLNGLTYHLRALKSDGSLFDLAKQGYELAVKFDPTNWIARYHLGLLYLDKRNYKAAENQIADALVYNNKDADMLYSMVVASYYAKDPSTAAAILSRLRKIEPTSKRVLRASTIVMAALDRPEEAQQYLERYQGVAEDTNTAKRLEARIKDWEQFYSRYGSIIRRKTTLGDTEPAPAQIALQTNEKFDEETPSGTEMDSSEGDREEAADTEQNDQEEPEEEKAPDEYRMCIVDVVIVRTEENVKTRKGVNLLNGLMLQFGNESAPAYSKGRTQTRTTTETIPDTIEATVETVKTITSQITIPALTYSLNIFNSNTERDEILARPSLVALNGQQSEFFAGTELQASAVGQTEGATVEIEKEIGVKLVITPEFLEDGRIKLDVEAERTFLKTPSSSVIYPLMVETSKTNVHANVVMNFGETLILSGLSEKETERKRNGVPLLQDIPLVQYLFSQKDTKDFQKSVLILITPRTTEYVYRNKGKLKKKSGQGYQDRRGGLSELQARYTDWFKPYPNWASVFHHLQENSLYREFRTGDVSLEHWQNQETLRSRLKQALGFLYY